MRTLLATIVILCCATAAQAQTPATPTLPPEPRGPVLITLYASYAVAEALDIDSTRRAIRLGAHESNSLMKPCVSAGLACMIPVKAAVTAGMIWTVDKYVRPKSKEQAAAMMLSVNILQWVVTGRNYSIYFQLRKQF